MLTEYIIASLFIIGIGGQILLIRRIVQMQVNYNEVTSLLSGCRVFYAKLVRVNNTMNEVNTLTKNLEITLQEGKVTLQAMEEKQAKLEALVQQSETIENKLASAEVSSLKKKSKTTKELLEKFLHE